MSICPKNKSSKEDERSESCKMQQVRRAYDAASCVQGMRRVQQA